MLFFSVGICVIFVQNFKVKNVVNLEMKAINFGKVIKNLPKSPILKRVKFWQARKFGSQLFGGKITINILYSIAGG